ncbi:hypothetical protein R3P38DRAFT_3590757 [Favolaschia claudopus]|uniref:SLC26A/SulP transporter domain-containing protein n=1 Tax=Favolaschia claudopus TaxID=2862362 RepID=A0AAW0AGF7_9AGAR
MLLMPPFRHFGESPPVIDAYLTSAQLFATFKDVSIGPVALLKSPPPSLSCFIVLGTGLLLLGRIVEFIPAVAVSGFMTGSAIVEMSMKRKIMEVHRANAPPPERRPDLPSELANNYVDGGAEVQEEDGRLPPIASIT